MHNLSRNSAKKTKNRDLKKETKILEMKNSIGLKNSLDQAEERISEFVRIPENEIGIEA